MASSGRAWMSIPPTVTRAAGGTEDAGDHPDGGGLARAVGPEQAEQLAAGHLEVDAVDRGELAVALGELGATGSRRPPHDGLDHVALRRRVDHDPELARLRRPAGRGNVSTSSSADSSSVSCPFATPTSGAATRARPQSPARCQADTSARRTCSRPAAPALVRDHDVQHEAGGQRRRRRSRRRRRPRAGSRCAAAPRSASPPSSSSRTAAATDRRERRIGRPEHRVHRFPRQIADDHADHAPASSRERWYISRASSGRPSRSNTRPSRWWVLASRGSSWTARSARRARPRRSPAWLRASPRLVAGARVLGLELERPPEVGRRPRRRGPSARAAGRARDAPARATGTAAARAGGRRPPPRTAGGGA